MQIVSGQAFSLFGVQLKNLQFYILFERHHPCLGGRIWREKLDAYGATNRTHEVRGKTICNVNKNKDVSNTLCAETQTLLQNQFGLRIGTLSIYNIAASISESGSIATEPRSAVYTRKECLFLPRTPVLQLGVPRSLRSRTCPTCIRLQKNAPITDKKGLVCVRRDGDEGCGAYAMITALLSGCTRIHSMHLVRGQN